jgi:hypothetical protein
MRRHVFRVAVSDSLEPLCWEGLRENRWKMQIDRGGQARLGASSRLGVRDTIGSWRFPRRHQPTRRFPFHPATCQSATALWSYIVEDVGPIFHAWRKKLDQEAKHPRPGPAS